jgi:hypothetical protein
VLDHKEAKLDAELQKFMAHCFGRIDPPGRRFASFAMQRTDPKRISQHAPNQRERRGWAKRTEA